MIQYNTNEVDDFYQLNEEINMSNGIFKLNWVNIKSAVVYGLVTAAIVFILSLAESILKAGSIFGIDWKAIIDTASIAALSLFVTCVSLVKNLLTTNVGNFLGITRVIPDNTTK